MNPTTLTGRRPTNEEIDRQIMEDLAEHLSGRSLIQRGKVGPGPASQDHPDAIACMQERPAIIEEDLS